MNKHVKPRRYDSSRRRAAAEQTRVAILDAATELFLAHGYPTTTMAAIAEAAEVNLDTVYAAVGPKPALFRLLIERAISGAEGAVPALERDYVRAIRAEPDPWRKLEIYARAVAQIQNRLAPLFGVLRQAAPANPELATLWQEIANRRARNMREFAENLAETRMLRPGVSVDEAADLLWTMNSSEFYELLVCERGWETDRFARWLALTWHRLLLRDP